MVLIAVTCPDCAGSNVIRHGRAPNGKQRYRCRDCGRSFRQDPGSRAYPEATKAQILAAYQERCSMRGVCRIFGVSRNTLSKWLKKTE